MSDLKRWLDDAAPPHIERLLHAAHVPEPNPATMNEAVHVILAERAGPPGGGSGPSGSLSTVAGTGAKCVVGALLTIGVLVGVALTIPKSPSVAPGDPPTPNMPQPPAQPSIEPQVPVPNNTESSTHPGTSPPRIQGPPPKHRKTRSDNPPPPRSPKTAPGSAAPRQLDFIRKADRALARRQPTKALAIISDYEKSFENRVFGPEAQLIQMNAYRQLGNDAGAITTARRILKTYPISPGALSARAYLKKSRSTGNSRAAPVGSAQMPPSD